MDDATHESVIILHIGYVKLCDQRNISLVPQLACLDTTSSELLCDSCVELQDLDINQPDIALSFKLCILTLFLYNLPLIRGKLNL